MINSVFVRFGETVRDGSRIWKLAPVIPALIVLPEFAQHVAEIQIGMFDSEESARALAEDSARWAFGYAKLAGLLLAILATIRFWGARSKDENWWDLRSVAWMPLLLGMVLIAATALPGTLAEPYIGAERAGWIDIALAVVTLPLLVLIVRSLAGDRNANLKEVFRNGWFAALRLLVFTAAVWIPLQWLHGMNHEWAFGAPAWMVWALMVFDSLVVGLLATMAGTALHHGAQPLDRTPLRAAQPA